jgi:hypothetical protein
LRGTNSRVITEGTANKKQLDRLAILQRTIEEHYIDMVELVGALSTNITCHIQQQNESNDSCRNGTAEIVSVVKRIDDKFEYTIASLEVMKLELEEQKSSLDMIQITLQEFLARQTTADRRRSGKEGGMPSNWVTIGTMLASTVSVFASGYTAIRSRAVYASTTNDRRLRQPNEHLSASAPSNPQAKQAPQRYDTKETTQVTVDQPFSSIHKSRTGSRWVEEFERQKHPTSSPSPRKTFVPKYPENPQPVRVRLDDQTQDGIVWYCKNCGDGPMPSWNIRCSDCGMASHE